jgi:peptide deformylase
MIYPIVVYGHPVLRNVAKDVEKDHPALQQLINDLFETMYNAEGIGLAAPQIGKSVRVFVIDGKDAADDEPEMKDFKKVFINAHVIEKSGKLAPMKEGCLSIPKMKEEVNRESHIRITYYDENWKFYDEIYNDYKARVILHEYDHLDGIMYTDKLGPLRKRLIKGRLASINKGRFDVHYKTILPWQKVKN